MYLSLSTYPYQPIDSIGYTVTRLSVNMCTYWQQNHLNQWNSTSYLIVPQVYRNNPFRNVIYIYYDSKLYGIVPAKIATFQLLLPENGWKKVRKGCKRSSLFYDKNS